MVTSSPKLLKVRVWVRGPAAVMMSVAGGSTGDHRNHTCGSLRAVLSQPGPLQALGQTALPLAGGYCSRRAGPASPTPRKDGLAPHFRHVSHLGSILELTLRA